MPKFRIYRLRDYRVDGFRQRTPDKARYVVSARDYLEAGEVEARSPYLAWKQLAASSEQPAEEGGPRLAIGDVIQTGEKAPLLCNFWGFDSAEWKDGIAPGAEPAHEAAAAVGTAAGAPS